MKALIVFGGWDGHEPDKIATILAGQLRDGGLEVELADNHVLYESLMASGLLVHAEVEKSRLAE